MVCVTLVENLIGSLYAEQSSDAVRLRRTNSLRGTEWKSMCVTADGMISWVNALQINQVDDSPDWGEKVRFARV